MITALTDLLQAAFLGFVMTDAGKSALLAAIWFIDHSLLLVVAAAAMLTLRYAMMRRALCVTIISLGIATSMSATCIQYPCYPDIGCDTTCYPDYDTFLTTEPDWCLYSPGDAIWTRQQYQNGQWITTGWYVYHGDDPQQTQQPAPGWGGIAFVGENCQIICCV